jgi:O-antigen ligase
MLIWALYALLHLRMSNLNHLIALRDRVPLSIALLALTPVIMVLLPWDFGPDSSDYRAFMRMTKLPTTVAELMFVWLAMSRGFAPTSALLALPRLAKLGLAMLAVSVLWTTVFVAAVPTAAFLGSIKFVVHVMFGLAMAHQLTVWTGEQRDLIWPAIGIGVVSFCLLWGVNIVFYHPVGDEWFRLVPTLNTMRSAGHYALAAFCAGIGMLHLKSDGRPDRGHLAGGVFFGSLGLALTFWTGTRAGAIAIFLAAILGSFILPVRRQLLILTLASTVIGLTVAAMLPLVHPFYGIWRMVGASISPVQEYGISSGRVEIWIEMLGKLADRPIMGWGVDQFRFSFAEGEVSIRHPHNGIMQLLFSTGLWGLSAAALIVIAFAKKIPRNINRPDQCASVAYAIGLCAYGGYDGPFYFTYPVMILMIAGACIIAPPPQSASDRSD